MMVILEMLSRAYGNEREAETYAARASLNQEAVLQLAVEAYELGLGMRSMEAPKDVAVGRADDIPDGERKIIEVENLSIGIFHHEGQWYAVRNSCLHRGGPVATGALKDGILTCPWHGYQYHLTSGELLSDPKARLAMYPVELRDGEIHLQIPVVKRDFIEISITEGQEPQPERRPLQANEFLLSQVGPGQAALVHAGGEAVAVFNVDGSYYATQEECTHAQGPLSEGELDGNIVVCPWHGSCFDVTNGEVMCPPARKPLKTYQVTLEGEIGRVE
jgi:nitrite reductase/ring-hydroxylating ferredoxin subunit